MNKILPLLLITNVLFAQSAKDSSTVLSALSKLNESIINNEVRKAAELYSDDFTLVTSAGERRDKDDMLKEISSPELLLVVNEIENPQVSVQGSTATLTGVLYRKGIYKGKAFGSREWIRHKWIRTVKGWKLHSGYSKKLPHS